MATLNQLNLRPARTFGEATKLIWFYSGLYFGSSSIRFLIPWNDFNTMATAQYWIAFTKGLAAVLVGLMIIYWLLRGLNNVSVIEKFFNVSNRDKALIMHFIFTGYVLLVINWFFQ